MRHACRETCSGWQNGYDERKADYDSLFKDRHNLEEANCELNHEIIELKDRCKYLEGLISFCDICGNPINDCLCDVSL